MRILLDTHVLIWWLLDLPLLPSSARAIVADDRNEIFVSAASAWEIAIKFKQGKLPEAAVFMADLEGAIANAGFIPLLIAINDGERAGSLPLHHKDPFDRMLIAQALAESLTLISNERLFDRYGVARLW
jgi:PIN domain nuclease of toxin-antitoxin system